jgi:hypothetical protein
MPEPVDSDMLEEVSPGMFELEMLVAVLAEALFLLLLPQPEITAARTSGAAAALNRLSNMLPPDSVVAACGDRRATPTAQSRT